MAFPYNMLSALGGFPQQEIDDDRSLLGAALLGDQGGQMQPDMSAMFNEAVMAGPEQFTPEGYGGVTDEMAQQQLRQNKARGLFGMSAALLGSPGNLSRGLAGVSEALGGMQNPQLLEEAFRNQRGDRLRDIQDQGYGSLKDRAGIAKLAAEQKGAATPQWMAQLQSKVADIDNFVSQGSITQEIGDSLKRGLAANSDVALQRYEEIRRTSSGVPGVPGEGLVKYGKEFVDPSTGGPPERAMTDDEVSKFMVEDDEMKLSIWGSPAWSDSKIKEVREIMESDQSSTLKAMDLAGIGLMQRDIPSYLFSADGDYPTQDVRYQRARADFIERRNQGGMQQGYEAFQGQPEGVPGPESSVEQSIGRPPIFAPGQEALRAPDVIDDTGPAYGQGAIDTTIGMVEQRQGEQNAQIEMATSMVGDMGPDQSVALIQRYVEEGKMSPDEGKDMILAISMVSQGSGTSEEEGPLSNFSNFLQHMRSRLSSAGKHKPLAGILPSSEQLEEQGIGGGAGIIQ